MTETWRVVPEWEGFYEVSDCGNVRSLAREVRRDARATMKLKGKMLKPSATPGGYLQVIFSHEGRHYNMAIHRLVLLAFVGECPLGMVACHNDGDQRNNHLSNLRWDTQSNNVADKISHGTHDKGENNPCAKLTDEQAEEIRERLKIGGRGIGRELAREFGVSTSTISFIKLGRSWTHVGAL